MRHKLYTVGGYVKNDVPGFARGERVVLASIDPDRMWIQATGRHKYGQRIITMTMLASSLEDLHVTESEDKLVMHGRCLDLTKETAEAMIAEIKVADDNNSWIKWSI